VEVALWSYCMTGPAIEIRAYKTSDPSPRFQRGSTQEWGSSVAALLRRLRTTIRLFLVFSAGFCDHRCRVVAERGKMPRLLCTTIRQFRVFSAGYLCRSSSCLGVFVAGISFGCGQRPLRGLRGETIPAVSFSTDWEKNSQRKRYWESGCWTCRLGMCPVAGISFRKSRAAWPTSHK